MACYPGAMPAIDPKTHVGVRIQYKSPNSARPIAQNQVENLDFELPHGSPPPALLIPCVGDTISLTNLITGQGRAAYKVLTRHFSYTGTDQLGLYVAVNIVVTDVEGYDMWARLHE